MSFSDWKFILEPIIQYVRIILEEFVFFISAVRIKKSVNRKKYTPAVVIMLLCRVLITGGGGGSLDLSVK